MTAELLKIVHLHCVQLGIGSHYGIYGRRKDCNVETFRDAGEDVLNTNYRLVDQLITSDDVLSRLLATKITSGVLLGSENLTKPPSESTNVNETQIM